MSSKSEPKADQGATTNKDKGSGSGTRRSNTERSSGNKSYQATDEHLRKKNSSSSSSQQTKHGGGGGIKESRNRTGTGGRDSTHSYKPDRYKKESSEHGSSRHGGGGRGKEGGHGWSTYSRNHRYVSESRKGHKVHSNRNKSLSETNGNLDSGISVDENSSPEGVAVNAKSTCRYLTDDKPSSSQMKEDVEDPVNEVETNDSTQNNESTVDKKSEDLSVEDFSNSLTDETCTNQKDDTVESRYIYTREFLLSLKDCTKSVMTPVGFDQLVQDVAKDILKAHHRHSGTDHLDDSPLVGEKDDDLSKHSNSFSLIREHDPKSNSKVSLMPQRRSFGSGCSWRDSVINKASSLGESQSSDPGDTPGEERGNDSFQNWSDGSQHVPALPKVINHVPYRSRHGEWKGHKGDWRVERQTEGIEDEVEEEPEWMSFGPSDRYEFMELKGIDEHEMEREARKVAEAKSKMKEEKSSPEESPSSSPLGKDIPKNYLVDSGLPSSCPNEEDDGFMLDGFDFKSVLSICQELASDSGDDEPNQKTKNSLSTARDENQLTNALISVLGISTDGVVHSDEREEVPGICHQEQQQQMGRKPQLKAMTLDEIEGQGLTHEDVDQSAFNRFLASMETKPVPHEMKIPVHTHSSSSGLASRPLPKTTATRSLFVDDLDEGRKSPVNSSSYQSDFHIPYPNLPLPLRSPSSSSSGHQFNPSRSSESPHHTSALQHQQQQQQQPHQGWSSSISSSWTGAESHYTRPQQLLIPSPSSLGMHPHHLRQHKHSLVGGSGGGVGGVAGGGSNNNWITEMEHLRISELNQMRMYPHPQHQYQQHQRDERQLRMMQHQQQQQHSIQKSSSSGGGGSPSLSFLPTSVMRHMHNSKSSQGMKDPTRNSPHSASGRLDQEFSTDAAFTPQHSTENPFHSSQMSPHPAHHYQCPQHHHHAYRPNLRGAIEPLATYQPPLPTSPIQQQYLRMGNKSNLY